MAHPILMPKPGQMTEECTLVAWHKEEGDEVHRGDILFEIETDKSNMDVESFDDGVLLRRYVEVGQTVPVNSLVAYVGAPGEAVPHEAPPVLGGATPDEAAVAVPVEPPGAPTPAPTAPAPAARSAPVAATAPATPPSGAATTGTGRIRISPRASRAAAAAGLDPRTITGTGPLGRITERDVQAAIGAAAGHAPAVPTPPAAPPGIVPAPATEEADWRLEPVDEAPRPMSRMRQIIARRLTESVTTIPHFTVTVAVDMTRLVALRQELRDAGTSLSVTDFILAAAAQSLVEFPEVNSRTDGISIWLRRRVQLGLAVSVPGGLVVPVIRDAERLTVLELHDRAAGLAAAARAGTLPVDDMTGSTFTVSNLGMLGVDEFSAIINPGEAGILAVSSVIPTPVAVGDGVTVRQLMKLTLSADHRLVDGELGARFLNAVRRRLEDAAAFRSEIAGS